MTFNWIVAEWQQRLDLEKKLPHFVALQKFNGRSQVVAIVHTLIAQVMLLALK